MRKRWNIKDIVAISILVLLGIFIVLGRTYILGVGGDIGDYFYAVASSNARYVANGQIPLWNPNIANGFPNTGFIYQIFYPIMNILQLVFFNKSENYLSFNFVEAYYIVHFIITALGYYFLTKQITKNTVICFSVSVLSVFAGAAMMTFHWFAVISGFAYIPFLIGFFILMAKENNKKSWIYTVGVGISIGLTGLAGVTHGLLIMLLIFAFLYFSYLWKHRKDRELIISCTLKCITSGLIGFGFCAVQLLPVIEFMSLSSRYGLTTAVDSASSHISLADFTAHNVGIEYFKEILKTNKAYLSLGIPLVLGIIVGFFSKAKENTYILNFAKFLFMFSLMMSMGLFFNDIVWYIPYLSSIRESYLYVSLIAMSGGIIACFGFISIKNFIQNKTDVFNNKATLAWIISIFTIFILLPHNFKAYSGFFATLTVLILIFTALKKKKLVGAILVICVLSNFYMVSKSMDVPNGNTSNQSNIIMKDTYKWFNDFVEVLEGEEPSIQDPYRVLQWTQNPVYPINVFASMGINDAYIGLNPIYKKASDMYMGVSLTNRSIIQNIQYIMHNAQDDENFVAANLDLTELNGVTGVPTDYTSINTTDIRVFKNDRRQGGAWMVYDFIPYSYENTFQDLANHMNTYNFKPETTALVNTDTIDNLPQTTKGQISDVEIMEYKANSMKIKVNNDSTGMLVTPEVYYNGWKVYVDGKKSDVSEVNYNYRGVLLEPGEHIVEFKFMPTLVIVGIIMILLSTVASFGIAYYVFRKKV